MARDTVRFVSSCIIAFLDILRRREHLFLVDLSSRHATVVDITLSHISHHLSAIPSAMATSKGTINGRYNICRHIGSGSFGT